LLEAMLKNRGDALNANVIKLTDVIARETNEAHKEALNAELIGMSEEI